MYESVDTLVIGGGQAGLATSHWLKQADVPHLVLERHAHLGGGWQGLWDGFTLVTPNFTLHLPGMPYAGTDPDGFLTRGAAARYVARYAAFTGAPIRTGAEVLRLTRMDDHFVAYTGTTTFDARNVVLATGPYQRPKIPPAARLLPGHVQHLHSSGYRRPDQLADGAVLVVGTGRSGTQIAEELHQAGRAVHLAVSMCPGAPRRYRGSDVYWWLLQIAQNGAAVGVPVPTVADLPSPAARFGCLPHLTGKDGGHDVDLRTFARQGMRLYGRLESIDDGTAYFTDDLHQRLAFAERAFDERFRPLFDAYIKAAEIDAPADDRPAPDTFTPVAATRLDLTEAGVSAVVWATGYRLGFDWVDLPVFDRWGYPRHVRGVVTELPGLYVVGLPWLHTEGSANIGGVGPDAAYVAEHLAAHRADPPPV